ncbi:hypothetical protein OHC33_005117 [Knufia fluminis]|uniref:Alpha/beta hydrolase fold-3 domain-containing protein n=1 Tax=Knufia fluminis TaxID=191047 RepID=A0AAN8ELX0_9EURO|nr:hypothetical protein OHC33_005117 [Knufia fluminis]
MLFRLALRTRHVKSTHGATWRVLASYRCFTTPTRFQQDDTVSLKVGGSGFVDLKITRPTQPTKDSSSSNSILVLLPSGPFPEDRDVQNPSIPDAQELSKQFPATTVIDLQYRLTPRPEDGHGQSHNDHRFPTPIHDIYTAWDYITDELGQHEDNKICLHGTHIGGAMALTLALTNPDQIHAVAVENPLVDWVVLDELATHTHSGDGTKRRTKTTKHAIAAAAQSLISLRTRLFRTPSAYFDAFASPTLFLRAPGRDTPLTKSAAVVDAEAEFEVDGTVVEGARIRYGEEEGEVGIVEYDGGEGGAAFGPYDDDWGSVETRAIREAEYARRLVVTASDAAAMAKGEQNSVSGGSRDGTPDDQSDSGIDDHAESPRRRKVLRRWPPNAQPEEVTLPYVNLFLTKPVSHSAAGPDHPQHTDITPVTWLQGMELVELLKRACFWGRERSFAEERVTIVDWNPAANVVDRQKQMAEWLQTKFDESD